MNLAFDIGAYQGSFARYLAQCGYVVVAVDPLAAMQSTAGITYVQAVVSDTPGPRLLHLNANPAISSIDADFVQHSRFATSPHYAPHAPFTHTMAVQAITYEQLVATHGTPHLAKVDVEGHEWQIIKNMIHLPKIIGFEWHQELEDTALSILHFLEQKGFNLFQIQEFTHVSEYHQVPDQYHALPIVLKQLLKHPTQQKPYHLRWGMLWATSAH